MLERILADDFIATSSRGEVRNKSREIDDIKPNPDYAMEAFNLDEMNVRIFGDTAIVTGRSTLKASYKGQSSPVCFATCAFMRSEKANGRLCLNN